MRDVHYDGAFAREFGQASKNWSWATWHEVQAQEDAAVRRLLDEVFGAAEIDGMAPPEGSDEGND